MKILEKSIVENFSKISNFFHVILIFSMIFFYNFQKTINKKLKIFIL
jgi:hypothetical protein